MRPRIKNNAWGNWYGYLGGRKVISFSNPIPGYGAELVAEEWAAEKTLKRDPSIMLRKAITHLQTDHWCTAYDQEAIRLLRWALKLLAKQRLQDAVSRALRDL